MKGTYKKRKRESGEAETENEIDRSMERRGLDMGEKKRAKERDREVERKGWRKTKWERKR